MRAIELSNLEKKMSSTPMALRRQGMLRKARRTALSDMGAVQASIHAASMPCLLKIACTRGVHGSATSDIKHVCRNSAQLVTIRSLCANRLVCVKAQPTARDAVDGPQAEHEHADRPGSEADDDQRQR